MLFGVYANDLPSTPKHCPVESYVDDTKLYMSFQPHDSGNIVAALNEDLVSILNWCFENGLLLNPDKTKLIIYGISINLLAFYHERCPLIGYATHVLFFDR